MSLRGETTAMIQKRVVLVTGGTSGLGRSIAAGYAAAGHDVLICARTAADCDRVAREIADGNAGTCTGFVCDLADHAAIERLAERIAAGAGMLHTLVNNAGAVAPGPLESVGEADWDRVLDVNLKAVFFLSQKLAPLLRAAASAAWPASIINIGSFAGGRVGPTPHYPYSAAKAGLRYLTKSLARELARDHVTVNAIALGIFPEDSGIMRGYDEEALGAMRRSVPVGRLGTASDIVALTGFLSSPLASYVTGTTIPLDGGLHI